MTDKRRPPVADLVGSSAASRRRKLALLVATLLAVAAVTAYWGSKRPGPRLSLHEVGVSGARRSFCLCEPESGPAGPRHPLLFVFGGVGQSAEQTAQDSQLQDLARREQAYVVYPEPRNRMWRTTCGEGETLPGNADLAFFDALYQHLVRQYPIDRDRVYALGISNGAEFVSLLVSQRSPRIAAAIMHSGGLAPCLQGHLNAERKIPLLVVAGTGDAQVPVSSLRPCVSALLREGHPVEFMQVQGLGHAWATTLNAAMWEFLERRRRE